MTLVQWLNNLPRYTLSFQRLSVDSGTSTSNWNAYFESLLLFIIVPACMCLVFIILDVSFQMCHKCRKVSSKLTRNANDEIKRIRTRRRRFLLSVVLGVIDIVLLCIAINWNFDLTEGVQNMERITLDIQDYQTTLRNHGSQTKNLIQFAKNNISQFLELHLPEDIHDASVEVIHSLDYAILATDQFVTQTSSSTIPQKLLSALDTIQGGEDIRSDMTAAIFFLFFCCLFFVLCTGILCKCPPCCNCFLTSFNYWIFLASWGIIGFHLALSVGIADVCVDPENYFRNVSQEVFKNSSDQSIFDYYLSCDDVIINPLSKPLITGARKLNETFQFIPIFQEYSDHHEEASAYVVDWINWTNFSKDQFDTLISYDLDCDPIHSDFMSVTAAVCDKNLPQLFHLFLYHAIACTIYIVALCMLSMRKTYDYNSDTYYGMSGPTRSLINGDTNKMRLLSEGDPSLDIGGEIDSDVDSVDFGQVAVAAANISSQKKKSVPPIWTQSKV